MVSRQRGPGWSHAEPGDVDLGMDPVRWAGPDPTCAITADVDGQVARCTRDVDHPGARQGADHYDRARGVAFTRPWGEPNPAPAGTVTSLAIDPAIEDLILDEQRHLGRLENDPAVGSTTDTGASHGSPSP